MSAISSNYTDNYGGLRLIKYAIAQEVADLIDFWPLWQGSDSIDISQAVLDEYFHDITPILETPSLQTPSELSGSGKQWNNSVQSRYNKDRDDIRVQLDKVGDRGLLLYIEDRNGLAKLIGTPESPVRQNEDYMSGMKVMDTNGYTLYHSGSTPHKPPKVNIT